MSQSQASILIVDDKPEKVLAIQASSENLGDTERSFLDVEFQALTNEVDRISQDIPFYRAYITDKIVAPENGPASRRLADAVRNHLITRDPYKSYGVTLVLSAWWPPYIDAYSRYSVRR